jgi:putative ABC transport system permease protein
MTRQLRAWFARLAEMFNREKDEQELAAEVESHLQMHVADFLRLGMTAEQARRAALIRLGGVEQTKEIVRDRRGLRFVETLLPDVRYSLRALRKNSGFTLMAVLTLTLGIGANAAIFSMVNALLLHPYDFHDLDRLVRVWENRGVEASFDARWISAPDAEDMRTGTQVFEQLATYRCQSFNSSIDGSIQPIRGCGVSADFFRVLGVGPTIGRAFTEIETQPGADQVAIVSRGLWQRTFGGSVGLSGQSLQLNGRRYTVIGVMPAGSDYPVPMELWVPLALSPTDRTDRKSLSFEALGRLKQDVTLEQARSALEGVSRRLQRDYPLTNDGRTAMLLPLRKELYLYTLPLFSLLQAAAVFVLLLAGANLANLLSARIIGRQKEIAVRSALGANRGRLLRLFVTETLLLSLLAAVAALAISFWSVNILRTSISRDWTMWVPGWDRIRLDATGLVFTLVLAACMGIVFGLITALHAERADPFNSLKKAGRGSGLGGGRRLSSALVVSQVAFAVVLLVCAGLTAQAFLQLTRVYQGFQPANVLKLEIELPEKSYPDKASFAGFYQRLVRDTSALPGAEAIALSYNSPASNVDNPAVQFSIAGRQVLQAAEMPSAELQVASPEYFSGLRIPLVEGRLFSDADGANSAKIAVISRSMAVSFWPAGDALGNQIRIAAADSPEDWMTVVGVVEDVRQNWWNRAARPTIYQPFLQAPRRGMVLLLRAVSNPTSYAAGIRDIVRRIDPGVAITGVNTLETEIADSIAIVRIMGALMTLFGCVALTLSSVGVYGVLVESVARRTPEIGVRLALGAEPRKMMQLVLAHALRLTAIGLTIGLPVAFVANRAMAGLIFGIVTLNPGMLFGFAGLFLLVALLAAYIPARRAMRVDPIVALRYE